MLAWTLTNYITQWIFVGIILACAIGFALQRILTRRNTNKCNGCTLSEKCGKKFDNCNR